MPTLLFAVLRNVLRPQRRDAQTGECILHKLFNIIVPISHNIIYIIPNLIITFDHSFFDTVTVLHNLHAKTYIYILRITYRDVPTEYYPYYMCTYIRR